MGNSTSSQITANFEDIQRGNAILIHVMEDETLLIERTLTIAKETDKINGLLQEHGYDKPILIYGKNVDDYDILLKKHAQLVKLGFRNVGFYPGGLFEWLLLRDVFGPKQFPTTTNITDIIKYRPKGCGI
jgi:hypothetical protein